MKASEIAAKLAKKPTPAELIELVNACSRRRDEIRTRQSAIGERSSTMGPTPERARAVRLGPDAVAALDAEIEALEEEHQYLNALEGQLYEAREAVLTAEARNAIPGAVRDLPGVVGRVHAAAERFDAAIAELNTLVATLSHYERMPDRRMPIGDRELAALLEARDLVWKVRHVAVLVPPDGYEKSCELYYEKRGADTTIVRRPGPYLPDFARDASDYV